VNEVAAAVLVVQATAAFLVLALVACLIMGLVGASIGAKKDMAVAGFLFGFLLGPVELVVIAVLPPSREQHERAARRQGLRPCPHCREFIHQEATACRYCRRDTLVVGGAVDEDALDHEWQSLYGS
jgi:hypothetical protein